MSIRKFVKRPVTIEAVQWTGDNLKEVIEFVGRHPKFDQWFDSWEEYEKHVRDDNHLFKIFTLECVMEASVGDWIIKGVKGECYPCKPDIFEMTYQEEFPPILDPKEMEPLGAEFEKVWDDNIDKLYEE